MKSTIRHARKASTLYFSLYHDLPLMAFVPDIAKSD